MNITPHGVRPILILLASLPLLGACQSTCTGDARSDNYWCAKNNLNKGVYRAQTAQLQSIAFVRQQELAQAKSNLAQKQAELDAARNVGSSDQVIASLQAEVDSLRKQVEALMQ